MKLARRGSLIIVDNVVREGAVLDADSDDASVQAMRRFFELAADRSARERHGDPDRRRQRP